MRFLRGSLFVILGFNLATEAIAQDVQTDVEAEIFLESVLDPLQDESQNVTLINQPKDFFYDPILVITPGGPDQPGHGTVTYAKDYDPYGEFVITVTAGLGGPMDVKYSFLHDIVNVSHGEWTVRTTLSVELIDLNDDGVVFLIPAADQELGALMVVGAKEDDGIFEQYIEYPNLTLGPLPNLSGEGTTPFDSGEYPFSRADPTTAMGIDGEFQLSSGDQAILQGRYDFYGGVPAESTSWGQIKALYR